MARTLYFISGSPFAWRVMLALGMKGLEYQAIELHGSKGDTKTPEYLALNPRGKVPVLVDGGVTVYESLAIVAYLEHTYPEKPLFGSTPLEAAHIWQRVMEVEGYLSAALAGAARPIFTQTFAGKEDEINENFSKAAEEIATVAGWLDGNDFMAGDKPTAIEAILYPALAMIARIGPSLKVPGITPNIPNYETDFPALAAWMNRVEALPYFDDAYPPHWRD
jgi:glutathione S-transferase